MLRVKSWCFSTLLGLWAGEYYALYMLMDFERLYPETCLGQYITLWEFGPGRLAEGLRTRMQPLGTAIDGSVTTYLYAVDNPTTVTAMTSTDSAGMITTVTTTGAGEPPFPLERWIYSKPVLVLVLSSPLSYDHGFCIWMG